MPAADPQPRPIAAADTRRASAAFASAAARGDGVRDVREGDHVSHASRLDQQPAPLRIILGCAERLEPLPPEVDLIKIQGSGGRVSYLRFDGFGERALPSLAQHNVIDLCRHRVEEIPVDTPDGRRVLLGKASFLPRGMPGRIAQEQFDDALRQRGVLKQGGRRAAPTRLHPSPCRGWRQATGSPIGYDGISEKFATTEVSP